MRKKDSQVSSVIWRFLDLLAQLYVEQNKKTTGLVSFLSLLERKEKKCILELGEDGSERAREQAGQGRTYLSLCICLSRELQRERDRDVLGRIQLLCSIGGSVSLWNSTQIVLQTMVEYQSDQQPYYVSVIFAPQPSCSRSDSLSLHAVESIVSLLEKVTQQLRCVESQKLT